MNLMWELKEAIKGLTLFNFMNYYIEKKQRKFK